MRNMQYITYLRIQKNVFNIYFIIRLNNGTVLAPDFAWGKN